MATSVSISPGCFVAQSPSTSIKGQITIGAGTVIHPAVTILAEVWFVSLPAYVQGGPIIIGENNLIEEQVVIINKFGFL
jgi:dynactin-6